MREISVDLPAFGNPTRPDVGDQLQLQADESLFAVLAGLGASRRAVGGGDEARVAAAAAAALGDEHALSFFREIRQRRACRRCSGSFSKTSVPTGTAISRSLAVWPGLVGALAVCAAPGFELGMKAEIDQRVLGGSGDDEDGAAAAAVAAVGTAARDELLAPETQAAITTAAGRDVDVHLVDEHL